ncbi:hypothetical protein ALT721_800082 [Alteromonas alvinellae]
MTTRRPFTPAEDNVVMNLIENWNYRYQDVAEVLGRSTGSIGSRVNVLRRQGWALPMQGRAKEPTVFAPGFPIPSLMELPDVDEPEQLKLEIEDSGFSGIGRKAVTYALAFIGTILAGLAGLAYAV